MQFSKKRKTSLKTLEQNNALNVILVIQLTQNSLRLFQRLQRMSLEGLPISLSDIDPIYVYI